MRAGAYRALGLALLASILLHAALFALLPRWRELSALVPPEPEPLIARVERVPPPRAPAPPSPSPAPLDARKPAPVAKPAAPPAPAPPPEPAPAPQLAQAQPAPAPAPAPGPALPPLTRIDPSVLAPAVPAPPAADRGALDRFRQDINSAAARFKRYPRAAIDNNWEGEVVVRMAVGADGRIASLSVTRGSGYEVLDRQALQMFENARPFVAIPPALRGKAFELELRAIYNLRDQRSG